MAHRRKRSGALWTVRYRGSDPFGGPILNENLAVEGLEILVWAKGKGLIDFFSAHDDDLVAWDPYNPEDYLYPENPIREKLAKLKAKINTGKLPMFMITCSLHGHPIFANGGFTNPNPAIRMLAMKKALRAAWIGNYFGAKMITYWVARDGFETPAMIGENPYNWLKQALDLVAFACQHNQYSIKRGTIEPKINEPRGFSYVPLVGSALFLISELENPDFWGVNPEIPQHSAMGNCSPYLEILQAVWADKLFFLHVGGQINGQFDDDFPFLFGPDGCKTMAHVFLALEQSDWDGVIEFDCHALRSDLASGNANYNGIMRQFLTYNAEMYAMMEQVMVPRLMANEKLADAITQLHRTTFLGVALSDGFRPTLMQDPSEDKIKNILSAQVHVTAILASRQNVLAVEEQFNLSLFGVTPEMLDMVKDAPAE